MKYNAFGRTGLKISELTLGSMTWGTQNTVSEGHAQIDRALERGVNCIDTAEMYPVNPISVQTQGDSERVIGAWNAKNKARRGDVMIATKVSGAGMKHVRDGVPISAQTIETAVENSLASLQTDYIDLYQLHWPNRGSYMFRQNWDYDPTKQDRAQTHAHMLEVLTTLQKLVDAGKIRHFGLSNESTWGTAQWLRLSEEHGLPRVVTVQNEYSLLCRLYDLDMAELSHNEDVGLFAFSPLATGILSGKYQGGVIPKGSRREFVNDLGGRMSERVLPSTQAYLDIAAKHGIDPVHMALAWCRTRPFMASAIFGSVTVAQLEHILDSVDVELSGEVLGEISSAHRANPMPY